MYWSCCFSSFALLLPSRVVYRPIRFKLTSVFEYSLSFFCFIMWWALSSTYLSTDQLVSYRSRLCRKRWVRTPAGRTLAIFLFFSLSMRKGCPRCAEGDKLQVLFHGTSQCCDILLLLYCGHIFFFMLILYCAISCGLEQCEEILKPQAPALKTMIGIQRYSYCQHPYSFVIDLSAKRTAYW